MTAEDDPVMEEARQQKEQGNEYFKIGSYGDALTAYSKAIKLNPNGGNETSTYYKNRAACYLKLEKNQEAINDCTAAIELTPTDPKALFRRCQAYENIEKFELAYQDAMKLVQVDPKNTAIHPVLRRLNPIVQDMIKKQHSTENKVAQMFDLAFTSDSDEKRKTAANNIIVLARESAGAEEIYKNDGINKLIKMIDTSKEKEIKLGAIRSLACLSRDCKERALAVVDQLTPKKLFAYISVKDEEISTAMANVLQTVINAGTKLEQLSKEREKHEEQRKTDANLKMRPFPFLTEKIDPEGHAIADSFITPMILMLVNAKVSAYGRDNILELLIKFVTRRDGVGWTMKFIAEDGIQNLLTVAGTVPEHKTLPITPNTRMQTSLCLSKIYDDLIGDKDRDRYRNAAEEYFKDQFEDQVSETKIESITALGALLQGPLDVGNFIIGKEGVLDLILTLANSGDHVHAKYAIEALVHSASKKDKCSGVIKQATPILKKLYQSPHDPIKVRALVGLCKLGSFGGSDASAKSFAEGSTQTLAKACRKFLCNASKDVDLRKWAAEGLAYLTLDADVKEELCDDDDAMKSLIDLAKVPEKGILYPVAQIFVNITNCYEKKEIDKDMLELAKFAQHHVPEEHDKDGDAYIAKRVTKLVKAGGVNALVAFSRTESAKDSDNSRELLARVYHAIAQDPENRGLLVQQGGAKTLIPFALNGTKNGKLMAAQALAKISITTNPEIAFPGQRTCEVVRPIIQLLDIERHALENFEALMALTNLASVSDSVRRRIVKEKGISQVEHYMFEEHEYLRRAAVECMCNLLMCEDVVNIFKGENDRVKLLVLYCGDEDDEGLVRAAAGALAMITYEQELAHKITTCTKQWFDVLQSLAAHPIPDIQQRGLFILLNMMKTDKELANKLVESNLLEVIMAVSCLKDKERQKATEYALAALDAAVEFELIKPNQNTAK